MKKQSSEESGYLDFMMGALAEEVQRQGDAYTDLVRLLHLRSEPIEVGEMMRTIQQTVRTQARLNLRTSPDMSAAIIKMLSNGTLLHLLNPTESNVIGKADAWVGVYDFEGARGFVSAQYVAPMGGRQGPPDMDRLFNMLDFFAHSELVDIYPDEHSHLYYVRLNERGHYLANRFLGRPSSE